MIIDALKKVVEGIDLTRDEASLAMQDIMSGNATGSQIASYITALRMKKETVEEIVGSAYSMRKMAEHPDIEAPECVDTCGTGGDRKGTFNISTAAALVAAGAGAVVAKHGNRSVSSKCGSADVLQELGCKVDLTPEQVSCCIMKAGIGFMFAPSFHKAMKYAIGPRKEIGIRTIFNILGPLTNPAGAKRQLLGVYHEDLVDIFPEVLKKMGSDHVMVVHGLDGLDEITLSGETSVGELIDGTIRHYKIVPEDYGFRQSPSEDVIGGTAADNARMIRDILNGQKGPRRDIVLLNAGAVIMVAGVVQSLKEGVVLASDSVDSGRAKEKLQKLIDTSNQQ